MSRMAFLMTLNRVRKEVEVEMKMDWEKTTVRMKAQIMEKLGVKVGSQYWWETANNFMCSGDDSEQKNGDPELLERMKDEDGTAT